MSDVGQVSDVTSGRLGASVGCHERKEVNGSSRRGSETVFPQMHLETARYRQSRCEPLGSPGSLPVPPQRQTEPTGDWAILWPLHKGHSSSDSPSRGHVRGAVSPGLGDILRTERELPASRQFV